MKTAILCTILFVIILLHSSMNAQQTHTPTKAITQIIQLEASEDFSFLLKHDFTLWATGNNSDGQLGDGTLIDKNSFIKTMTDVRLVSSGIAHTLMLKIDNSLWVAGNNEDGQIGLDTLLRTSTPVKLMDNVKECLALDFCSYILDKAGNFYVSGSQTLGQDPYLKPHVLRKNLKAIPKQYYDAKFNAHQAENLKIPKDAEWTSSNGYVTMVLKSDHTLWSNFLDHGSLFVVSQARRGQVIEPRDINHFQKLTDRVYAFALGNTYALIYKYNGTLWVLGLNSKGQLGDGTRSSRAQLTELPIPE